MCGEISSLIVALDLDKILIINNESRNGERVRTHEAVNKDAVKKKFHERSNSNEIFY